MSAAPRQSRALGSWKEIAAYLGKGVRTVQRWERQFGLPVRRPNSLSKGIVFAAPEELDRWLRSRWAHRTGAKPGANGRNGEYKVSEGVRISQELRHANSAIAHDLMRGVQELREKCEELARSSTPLTDGSKVRTKQAKLRRT